MYLLNWLRLIPDADYDPVALLSDPGVQMGAVLDLTFATLRSVSPIHLEYLRNMSVRASMSVSLVARPAPLGGEHPRLGRHFLFHVTRTPARGLYALELTGARRARVPRCHGRSEVPPFELGRLALLVDGCFTRGGHIGRARLLEQVLGLLRLVRGVAMDGQ
jgi:hypothetical protein